MGAIEALNKMVVGGVKAGIIVLTPPYKIAKALAKRGL